MSETTYLVTARKYRPQLFKDVVAQEHVTGTLKNAIRLDRLAHAYMFTGPRGVGKTTAARILAKAINCTTPAEEREDGAEPCRTCDSCRSFEEGRNMNIIEIDAASNNSVNDVRELRETVRIPPQGTRMKVYIVDEVHMLSSSAFNAFLKTLEEPPPHALFIFATTEPHKVIPTIQSRCQRFDFRRITIPETITRLQEICESESISADEESLMLIARKGDGALRDSLSVFDQAVSLCGTDITYESLAQALGVVDTELYFDVSDAIAAASTADVIRLVDRVVRAGYDLHEFMDGLSEHFRDLLVAATIDDDSFIHATETVRARIRQTATRFEEVTLLRLIQIVGDAVEQLRDSRQPRLHLEMALLRMAALPASVDIRSALTKLDRLDRMADTGKLEISVRQAEQSAGGPPVAPAAAGESGARDTESADASTEQLRTRSADRKPSDVEPDPGPDAAPDAGADSEEEPVEVGGTETRPAEDSRSGTTSGTGSSAPARPVQDD
ncbi:MAG: DNA polymerase III subunit gamma/tau, partial [Rhodothermales bacterium]|nr:DNA polymerase III subunit gamma/tau [Rhodothermales bacterium]